MADSAGVDIRYYSVIYAAIDDVEAALKGMLKPIFEEKGRVRPRSARSSGPPRSEPSRAAWSSTAACGAMRRRGWSATVWWSPKPRSRRCGARRMTPPRSVRASSAASRSQLLRHQDRRRDRDLRNARKSTELRMVVRDPGPLVGPGSRPHPPACVRGRAAHGLPPSIAATTLPSLESVGRARDATPDHTRTRPRAGPAARFDCRARRVRGHVRPVGAERLTFGVTYDLL